MELLTKDKTFTHSNTSSEELDRLNWIVMPFQMQAGTRRRINDKHFLVIGGAVDNSNKLGINTLDSVDLLDRASSLNHNLITHLLHSFEVCENQNWASSNIGAQIFKMTIPQTNSCHRVDLWKDNVQANNRLFTSKISNIDLIEKTVDSISKVLLARISSLEKANKKQEAIKETHKLIHDLLALRSMKVIDHILAQSINITFSLPVLVAFLAATKKVSNELENRMKLFIKAEQMAIDEIGEEKLGKSIFRNLK